jgi:hypothetical protein
MYYFPLYVPGAVPNQPALTQSSFAVAVTGSDNAPGTPAQPWRTLAKLQRALQGQRLNESVDTTVAIGPGIYNETLCLECVIPFNRRCVITGSKTVVRNGTITAFTPMVPAIRVPAEIQDAGLVAATHVNRRFRMTSGPALGAIAWGLLATAADTMRISQLCNPSDGNPLNAANGDTYVIETLDSSIGNICLSITGGGNVVIQDLDMNSASSTSTNFSLVEAGLGSNGFTLSGCSDQGFAQWNNSVGTFIGCMFRSTLLLLDAFIGLAGAAFKDGTLFIVGGDNNLSGAGTCTQGGDALPRFTVGGFLRLDAPLGIFDDPAGATAEVLIEIGGTVVSNTAPPFIWDVNPLKDYGIKVKSGGRRFYTTIDTASGGVDDTNLGGVDTTYAAIAGAPLGSIVTGNDAGYVLYA